MSTITLLDLVRRALPPVARAEGDCIPWNDPEFSRRMLDVHLSATTDLASRRGPVIDAHVAWLHDEVLQSSPSRVLDLGCGPGLYLHRLARRGHTGVGIDFGPASIAYAEEVAARENLALTFVQADLREADLGHGFDLVVFIYGQINVLSRSEAGGLLARARAALKPGGRIVLETQTYEVVRGDGEVVRSWSTEASGLFADGPHLTLHERVWDPKARATTERWYIVDAQTAAVTRYAQTTEAYAPAEVSALLESAGFSDASRVGHLPGSPDDGALSAFVAAAG